MTVDELVTLLNARCVDREKEILIWNCEWDRADPIDFIDFDSDGNPVLY